MNNSEEIDDQISNIIDDINNSRYKDAEVNEIEGIMNDKNIVEDTSQTQKKTTKENAGKGIACLWPSFTGNCTIV